jgi:hypothetical protein
MFEKVARVVQCPLFGVKAKAQDHVYPKMAIWLVVIGHGMRRPGVCFFPPLVDECIAGTGS